jgi:branched-chain amino acid transport system permease protein
MHSLLAFGGVSFDDLQPYIPIGLALGGVYAFSGLGIVVLYRTTGVINLAFGAIGAAGGLISWYLIEHHDWPQWPAYFVCILFGGVVTLLYGLVFGPAFAARDPLVKMMGTLGLALILLGLMAWRAPPIAASVRILHLPTSDWQYRVGGATVSGTQTIALVLAVALTVVTTVFLRFTRLGTAMRGLADDREITAMLGVPVRRVEAYAWFGSGLVCGTAGLVLADQLGTLDYAGLSFPLVIAALAAALIGRLNSLVGTLLGGLAIGLLQGCLTAYFAWPTPSLPVSQYRAVTPFVLAILALLWFARRRVVVISRTAR